MVWRDWDMVACMSYIDVELFTNIANNYLQKKFDLGRPSVFLFHIVVKFTSINYVWQHVFYKLFPWIIVSWYTQDMMLKCAHFVAKAVLGSIFFLWRIVTFPKLVLRSKPKIYCSILFLLQELVGFVLFNYWAQI